MKKINNLKTLSFSVIMFLFIVNTVYSKSITVAEYSTYYTIKGKVVDDRTKKPIVFVTVAAVGTNIATVTNSEGEFVLNIDKSLNVTQISFKYIAYKNKTVSFESFKNKEVLIRLRSNSVSLKEVVVKPNNPRELIEEALRKIPDNYSSEPNKMIAFYRETIKKRKKYVSVSEAVVEVYKAPYNKVSNDMVKLYKGRKSSKIKSQDTIIVKLRGGPKAILLLDIAKNPRVLFDTESLKLFSFQINEIANINDKQNYVIEFNQIKDFDYPLFDGKVYVDVNTLAITATEFSLNLRNKESASRLFVKKKPLLMTITPESTKYIVKYSEDNGKFYFSHARGEITFKVSWKKRLLNSKYTVVSEIATTDRTNKNVIKIPLKNRLKSNIIFEDKVRPYTDQDFWGKYNTIKPEESIEKTIKKYGVKLKINNN